MLKNDNDLLYVYNLFKKKKEVSFFIRNFMTDYPDHKRSLEMVINHVEKITLKEAATYIENSMI